MPFLVELLIRALIEANQSNRRVAAERALERERERLIALAKGPPPPTPEEAKRAVQAVTARLDAIARSAQLEAGRCGNEPQNRRFVETLGEYVPRLVKNARARLAAEGARAAFPVGQLANRLQSLVATASHMAAQRRDRETLLLLGDADALADACYRPLIEFARGEQIRITSSAPATYLGENDLAIFLGFAPSGLAPIVLPSAWATELGWWPALAHEIGHDFWASVDGFEAELRARLGLASPGPLPDGRYAISSDDLDAAFATWLPELFADCFGTLMLGPAYVVTMIWSFADPEEPASVRVLQPDGRGGYEEHPPGHLRVVAACRLLDEIGFPADADRLEAVWRKRHAHGDPQDRFFLPTRSGQWRSIAEASLVDRAAGYARAIYEGDFSSLSGIPLRSIPGVDFGPREHQAALDARSAYFAGVAAPARDPRALIAGAVLAWEQKPELASKILRAARATIRSVGVERRPLAERVARDVGAAALVAGEDLAALARDALLLDAVLERPIARRSRR